MGIKRIYLILLLCLITSINQGFSQRNKGPNKLYPILFNYAKNLYDEYPSIPQDRRYVLEEIANYLIGSLQFDGKADLLLIGTNNATRSILAEAWANTAAHYYGIENVRIYSGGLKEGTISPFAIMALEKAGFIAYKVPSKPGTTYEINYTYNSPPLILEPKKYNNDNNPDYKFGAVMVCANADINLSVVKGNNFRTALHYYDPSAYEDTPDVLDVYLERNREIAKEMFYLFYRIKNAK